MKLFQVISLAREYLVLGIIGLIFIGIISLILKNVSNNIIN